MWVNFGVSCNERCWYILWPFGILYEHMVCIFCANLVHLLVIWYIFSRFGMLQQEKSGSPGWERKNAV
jgi:hypothetical protein